MGDIHNMSYGIELLNKSGGLIIDSEDNLAAFYINSTGAPTTGPVSVPSGRFLLAAPPVSFTGSDGMVTLKSTSTSSWTSTKKLYFETGGSPPSNGNVQVRYISIEPIVGNINPAGSGYGIEVYNSNGPGNGNLIFSSQANLGIGIISMGTFGDTNHFGSGYFDVNIPSEVAPNNVYVLVSNTLQAGPNYGITYGNVVFYYNYTYDFSGTTKKVRVNSYHQLVAFNSNPPTPLNGGTVLRNDPTRVWAVFNVQGVA